MTVAFGVTEDWIVVPGDPRELATTATAQGWSDGLPGIPPTRARIEEVLNRWGLDPQEGIGPVPPADGEANYARIAANAVYAGCDPEVFPVVVAALQAMLAPEFNLDGVQSTTHPVAPLVIVHGGAVDDLGFNAGAGVFGPGNRANATVGRAVRLCLLNIGGASPGERDRATQGQPSKYGYCIGENAAESPWPPFHVHRTGADAGTSAVTVFGGENPHNVNDHVSLAAPGILDTTASAMANLGANSAHYSQGEIFLVLSPEHARTVADSGFSRRDVQLYLYEQARLTVQTLAKGGMTGMDAWAPWKHAVATDGDVRLPPLNDPDDLHVLVSGGPGKHSSVIQGFGATRAVTRVFDERFARSLGTTDSATDPLDDVGPPSRSSVPWGDRRTGSMPHGVRSPICPDAPSVSWRTPSPTPVISSSRWLTGSRIVLAVAR